MPDSLISEIIVTNSAVPWPVAAGAYVFLAVMAVWAIIMALAPYLLFCHQLVMNPKLRRFASLGIVPLAMFLFPFVRRHILRRYLRGLRRDVATAEWLSRYVLPSNDYKADRFGSLMKRQKKVLVAGPSGIGKSSYLKYLTASYSEKRKRDSRLENPIPVYFPLVLYQTQDPHSLFQQQLAHYGQLTDVKLNSWFLKKGRFLLLIDGLNEIAPPKRQQIAAFAGQYNKTNYFCFSSQEYYAEVPAAEKLELIGLEPEKVREFTARRLEREKAEYVIKHFNQPAYNLYSLPQNLEFGLDIVECNNPLPLARRDLYETVMAPVLKLWEQTQRTDYPVTLFSRAYDMLKTGHPFLESQNDPSRDDFLTPLLRYKILVPYGSHYLFRHDLIRAYLANKYFAGRWQDLLLKDLVTSSPGWRSMLEFVLLDFESQINSREFLFAVASKNYQLAGELYKWLSKTAPDLCSDWSDDFLKEYGKKVLELV